MILWVHIRARDDYLEKEAKAFERFIRQGRKEVRLSSHSEIEKLEKDMVFIRKDPSL